MRSRVIFCAVFILILGSTTSKPTRPELRNRIYQRSHFEKEFFQKYRHYDELESYLQYIERRFPQSVTKKLAGFSTEGRSLNLYTITNENSSMFVCKKTKSIPPSRNSGTSEGKAVSNHVIIHKDHESYNDTHKFIHLSVNEKYAGSGQKKVTEEKLLLKPVIFIDAGAHSREWISPAATLYFMEKLSLLDPSLTKYIEWKIFPLINPDGYIYSWATNRMWRKTRSKSNISCPGADLNRNFAFHWGEVDTAKNPCLSYYGGSEPFSEPESRAIKNSVEALKNPVKAYITIHNWGQEIMYPFSHSTNMIPHNEHELIEKGRRMASAIKKSQGVDYRTGRASVSLYPSSGTVIDWAYAVQNISLSYTFELRDTGTKGFFLPEKYIKPTGEDLIAAMTSLGTDVYKEFLEANSCIEDKLS